MDTNVATVVLDQLRALRAELAAFRVEMHVGFADVQQALHAVERQFDRT